MPRNGTAREKGLGIPGAADLPRKISSVSWKHTWHKDAVMAGTALCPSRNEAHPSCFPARTELGIWIIPDNKGGKPVKEREPQHSHISQGSCTPKLGLLPRMDMGKKPTAACSNTTGQKLGGNSCGFPTADTWSNVFTKDCTTSL